MHRVRPCFAGILARASPLGTRKTARPDLPVRCCRNGDSFPHAMSRGMYPTANQVSRGILRGINSFILRCVIRMNPMSEDIYRRRGVYEYSSVTYQHSNLLGHDGAMVTRFVDSLERNSNVMAAWYCRYQTSSALGIALL